MLAGLAMLLYTLPFGLGALALGVVLLAVGIIVLTRIPDVVGTKEDLW